MTTKFFQVGGSVRDKILGVKSKDIDYAVECESFDAMREEILKRGGKIFVETPQFLTIRAMMPKPFGAADFVLCRKDSATGDGRRPDFVTPGTILDDLARRDFTVNAMAIDIATGNMIDPHDGIGDCRRGLIRCVGDPLDRFNEDALRILRALRFTVTKDFDIESNTEKAILHFSHPCNFKNVSTERIREELFKMFAKQSARSFRLLTDFSLWPLIQERGLWFKPTTESV